MNRRRFFHFSLVFCLVFVLLLSLSSCACEHDWEDIEVYKEASCVETGRAKSTCKICGVTRKRELPLAEHQGKVVVLPTCTKEGYSRIDCPVCGHHELLNTYPALGHKTQVESVFCYRCDAVASCESYFVKLMEYEERDTLGFRIESLPVSESIYIIKLEMRLAFDGDGVLIGEGTAELRGGSDGVDYDAYVYGDTVYLCDRATAGYQIIPLYVIAEGFEADIPDSPADMPETSEGISLSLGDAIEFFKTEIEPILNAAKQISEERLDLAISHIISSAFDVTVYEGYNFHLSADKLKALNKRLSEESVSAFIDKEFGSASFDKLESEVLRLLSQTVGSTIFGALAEGVTAQELVRRLDAFAALLTGDKEASISGLLSDVIGEGDIDLLAILLNDELMSRTVADITAEVADTDLTGEELIWEAEDAFAEMREKSLYLLAGIAEEDIEATREAYDAQIDAYLELFSFSFKGSADGELLEVSVGLPFGASVPSRFTVAFGECESPSVGNIPNTVQGLLASLKVQNGTKAESESKTTGGVRKIEKSEIEFVSLEDGTVTAIRSRLSVITYEFSGETEKVIYNGTEQTAWLYDAVEEIYVFELPLSEAMEAYVRDDCCDWLQYTFYKTVAVDYTKNTFVISEIGRDEIFGEILTSTTLTAEINGSVGFWYSSRTGEVKIDGEFEPHEYVYEKTVTAQSCNEEGYELWGCPDCDMEERRNTVRGPHIPIDGRGICSICGYVTFNTEDAIYIYESEDDDGYVEFFESEATGYIEVDGEYSIYQLSWKIENGQYVLYFSWNNRVVLTLEMVDGRLVKVEE
ncbi:MAG: hypothetical protein IJF05_05780 [Clostridia bacterium]|nr:hypothetical protein [Clostridia bacterium]